MAEIYSLGGNGTVHQKKRKNSNLKKKNGFKKRLWFLCKEVSVIRLYSGLIVLYVIIFYETCQNDA